MSTVPADPRDPYLVVDSPYEVARWRPLANFVLAVPHMLIAGALGRLANVVFFIYWLNLLFTGNLNRGMYGLLTMSERYNERSAGFLLGWSEAYPPFDFTTGPQDNLAYPPIALRLPEAPETAARSAALNVFKAIPHYFVLAFFGIGAMFVALAAWFTVLFTGRWPSGMRDFIVRVANYWFRIWAYVAMVEPGYPKFGLD